MESQITSKFLAWTSEQVQREDFGDGDKLYKIHYTVNACDISSEKVEQIVITVGADGSVGWRFRSESSV